MIYQIYIKEYTDIEVFETIVGLVYAPDKETAINIYKKIRNRNSNQDRKRLYAREFKQYGYIIGWRELNLLNP